MKEYSSNRDFFSVFEHFPRKKALQFPIGWGNIGIRWGKVGLFSIKWNKSSKFESKVGKSEKKGGKLVWHLVCLANFIIM
jgi:hypothetical protein